MTADIIKNMLIVGAGSFIGGGARYLVSVAMKSTGSAFPWGTLTVNLLGCLAIGLIGGFLSRTANEGGTATLFLAMGICGGFTTFSTFSKEALAMLQSGNFWGAISYIAASAAAGVVLTALGYRLSA